MAIFRRKDQRYRATSPHQGCRKVEIRYVRDEEAVTLAVEEEGEGPPLIFLHALGASGRYFGGRLDTLPASYRCIMPDLLGFGRSPKPDDSAYTVNDHLAALENTLAQCNLADQPLALIGHSLGAILAVAYAARYPQRVRSLVVIGLPLYESPAEARAFIHAHGGWLARLTIDNGPLARLLCIAMCTAPGLSANLALTVAHQFPPEVARDAIEHTWESYSRTLQHCILDYDLAPALARLTALPVLALHGERDAAAPLAAVERLAARMPNVELRTLPGGHHLFLQQHAACLAAIEGYLAR